ncbi:hypothetical protein HDU96_010774 [Phlyctochytrium bullatum]|nr:hypothetical protein HDU96_010774 [Phlyctochytrium bullatum]
MPSAIELIPVEVARHITIHLHPEWLPNLLSTSQALRRLFAPSESELPFAGEHLRHHFGDAEMVCEDAEWTARLEMAANVPFRRLPDVYAIAWLGRCWEYMAEPRYSFERAMNYIVSVFPDVEVIEGSFRLAFRLGPHRPVAWMERILLKALNFESVFQQQCGLAFSLASLLDSVAIVEAALRRLFPQRMKSEVSVTGASEVVILADMPRPFRLSIRPLDADDKMKDTDDKGHDSFAWCVAFAAVDAVENGAVHVLEYALQHPLVPVAFSYCRSDSDLLIHSASKHAHMHVIHYLLGNPLPLAPPPASRPIRPGDLPCSNDLEGEADRDIFDILLRCRDVKLCRENPLADLTQPGRDDEPPLQNLLGFTDHDPLRATAYLLDQGAPPNRKLTALSLRSAPPCSSAWMFRDRASAENNAERALELLECGAERDAEVKVQYDHEDEDDDVYSEFLGWTPLNFAVDRKNHDVARVLLTAGATLLIREEEGDDVHIDDELRKQLMK